MQKVFYNLQRFFITDTRFFYNPAKGFASKKVFGLLKEESF